jgi:glucose-1-phosphatase
VTKPKVLLFDIGGVLVENALFTQLNSLLPNPLSDASIKSKWLASAVVRDFELGITSPETFGRRFVEEWNIPLAAGDFLEAFASWPKGFYPGALELLHRLRRHYRVACLSNSNALHWGRFDGFVGHFQVALSSHLLGAIKPDVGCFTRALHELDSIPEEIAFFDDSLDNVGAAHNLGIRAFHVCGLNEVKSALVECGLLQ